MSVPIIDIAPLFGMPGEARDDTDRAILAAAHRVGFLCTLLRRHLAGAPHTDSGFVTVLDQDDSGGLQARSAEGRWADVPPLERALVVNFGQVLERWCGGRIRATEHRVLGSQRERFSIPFFYEARADATIAPLPIDAADSFEPFLFGDYLWERIVRFVEFRGMQALRPATT